MTDKIGGIKIRKELEMGNTAVIEDSQRKLL
jgi:hypothetical protein